MSLDNYEPAESRSSTAHSSMASSPLHSHGSVQNLDFNGVFETRLDPPTERELNSLTYYDLIQDLPCMQGSASKLPGGIKDQLSVLEKMYERTRVPNNVVSGKELVVYGMLKHHVHSDWIGASECIQRAIDMDENDLAALNAYGSLMLDVGSYYRLQDNAAEREYCQRIFKMALKWQDGKVVHPNYHNHLQRNLSRLAKKALQGFRYLHNFWLEVHRSLLTAELARVGEGKQ